MRRRAFAIVLLLSAVVGFGAIYVYPILTPVHVDASQTQRGNLYVTVRASGQVVPKELVPVVAPAPAKVVSIAVTLGQEVKKGDVLMDIELTYTGQGLATPESQPGQVPSSTPSPTAPLPTPTNPPASPPTQPPQTPSQPTPGPSSSNTPTQPPASPTQTPPSPSPVPTQPVPSPSPVPTQPVPSPSPAPTQPSPSLSPAPTQAVPSPFGAPAQPSPAPTQPYSGPSPSPSPAPSATPTPAPVGTYTVQPGDTLSEIAARNGTTVEAIARSNGINNPDLIFPGQQLNIPRGQGGTLGMPPQGVARAITTIVSPIDGQVSRIEVRADQLVAPPAPLVVVADMTSLYLEILVDQEDLQGLSKGQSAQTVLDALPKDTIRGKVEEVTSTLVTGASGTSGYPVKVVLDSPPKGLRLGMAGQVEIVAKQLSGVLYVPKRAVLERQGEALVFVIEEDRVQMNIVTLGQKTRDYYEITAGLVEGQQVVVSNLEEMEDGKRVVVDRVLGPK